MEILDSYNVIIEASAIIILSFLFGEVSRKTNIPSVLMLIILGIVLKFRFNAFGVSTINLFPLLEMLGIVGLTMIVLEAALELKLKREKYIPIAKAFGIDLIVLIFQNIKSHTKLFLLITVLLLLYAIGKKMHLSSLIIILIFGLLIANMKLFSRGPLSKWLHIDKAKHIYEGYMSSL